MQKHLRYYNDCSTVCVYTMYLLISGFECQPMPIFIWRKPRSEKFQRLFGICGRDSIPESAWSWKKAHWVRAGARYHNWCRYYGHSRTRAVWETHFRDWGLWNTLKVCNHCSMYLHICNSAMSEQKPLSHILTFSFY